MRGVALVSSLLCGIWCVVASAGPQLTGTPGELKAYLAGLPKLVKIVGTAEVRVQADEAVATIVVAHTTKSLEESLTLNQRTRVEIVAALQEVGIAADKITASHFSSTPQHSRFSDNVKGYRAESMIRISVKSEAELQAVGKLVDERGEVGLQGIEMKHSQKKELERNALRAACEDAMRKREIYQEALGVELVPVSIGERQPYVGAPRMMGGGGGGFGGGSGGGRWRDEAVMGIANEVAEPDSSGVQESFDELVFRARVTVTFQIS